jgi:hypothetical protein
LGEFSYILFHGKSLSAENSAEFFGKTIFQNFFRKNSIFSQHVFGGKFSAEFSQNFPRKKCTKNQPQIGLIFAQWVIVFLWVSDPLCLSSSSALHFLSQYSFRVHHLVNRDERQLLAHAMASDFSVAPMGDCLLWVVFINYAQRSSPSVCFMYCFPKHSLCNNFGKKWVGLHFGRFFPKLIWSPC